MKLTHIKHFDMQPLVSAYQSYIEVAQAVFESKSRPQDSMIEHLATLFMTIGKEQAKLPVCFAQEFCANNEFADLDAFIANLSDVEGQDQRTTKLQNPDTNIPEYWFKDGKANENLGQTHAIFKFRTIGKNIARVCGRFGCLYTWSQLDLQAILAIAKQRFEVDRIALLEQLQTQETQTISP